MKKLMCKAWGEKIEIIELTFSEFMKKFRAKGYGTIEISAVSAGGKEGFEPVGPIDTVIVDKVICDFCNDEIKSKVTIECPVCRGCVETDEESKVYIDSSYGICRKCFRKSYKVIEGKSDCWRNN